MSLSLVAKAGLAVAGGLAVGLSFLVVNGGDQNPTAGRAEPPGTGKPSGPPVVFIGIDSSGSALPFHQDWLPRIGQLSDRLPLSAAQEVYRFDTAVHELYVGPPISRVSLKRMINVVDKDRGQVGTSLKEFAKRVESRLAKYPDRPAMVWIFTDCGVERMTKADHDALRSVATRWSARPGFTLLTIVGVRPLHREALRTAFDPLGDRLMIE